MGRHGPVCPDRAGGGGGGGASSVADLGVLALPLRVEAVLQTILVFLG
jgi:hypothetical protein